MGTRITVRDLDPGDKSRLRREARQIGISIEELVHRLIHEKRTKSERRPKPSEAFAEFKDVYVIDAEFGRLIERFLSPEHILPLATSPTDIHSVGMVS